MAETHPIRVRRPWWTGDNTTEDKLGKNNTSAGDGGAVGYTQGQVGNAFQFNRTQRLEQPSPELPNATFTIEGWVKRDASIDERILDHSTAGDADGFHLDIWETKLRLQIMNFTASSENAMPVGVVTHVAGTFDGRYLRVFIDGVAKRQTDLGTTQPLPTKPLPLRIGGGATRARGSAGSSTSSRSTPARSHRTRSKPSTRPARTVAASSDRQRAMQLVTSSISYALT